MKQKKARKKVASRRLKELVRSGIDFYWVAAIRIWWSRGLDAIFSYQSSESLSHRGTTKFPCTKFKKTRLGRSEDQKTTTQSESVLEKTLRSSRFLLFIVRWLGALLFAHKFLLPSSTKSADTTILLRRDRKEGKLVFVNPTISASYPRVITS